MTKPQQQTSLLCARRAAAREAEVWLQILPGQPRGICFFKDSTLARKRARPQRRGWGRNHGMAALGRRPWRSSRPGSSPCWSRLGCGQSPGTVSTRLSPVSPAPSRAGEPVDPLPSLGRALLNVDRWPVAAFTVRARRWLVVGVHRDPRHRFCPAALWVFGPGAVLVLESSCHPGAAAADLVAESRC